MCPFFLPALFFVNPLIARAFFNLENIKRAEVSNFNILDPLLRVLLKKAGQLQLPLQRAHKKSRGDRSGESELE